MSFKDRFLVAAGLESEDDIILDVTPEEVVEIQQDQAIAEAQEEVAEAQVEIVQAQNDLEVLEERVEDLEEAIEGVEAMIRGDRAWNSDLCMEKYNEARKIVGRTYGDAEIISLKGAEAFGDKDTGAIELASGLESMKEKAGEMWKGVKQFFINLYNHIIAFFVGIFNTFRGIEKKADAVIARLNALADDKIKKEIKLGAWNVYLNLDKNAKGQEKVTAVTGTVVSSLKDLAKALDTGADIADVRKALSSVADKADSKASGGSNENSETIKATFGAVTATITLPKSSPKEAVDALKETKVTFSVDKASAKTDGTVKVSKSKSDLVGEAKDIRQKAIDARIADFDKKALENKRDKAIAQIESGEGEKEEKAKKVAKTKASSSASLAVSRELSKFSAKALSAGLSAIQAHY